MPAPTRADRARFALLVILGLGVGWTTCFLATAFCYSAVIDWIHTHLQWALAWPASLIPFTFPGPGGSRFTIDNWFEWGPGLGATWFVDTPQPTNVREFLAAVSSIMQWVWLPNETVFAPLWVLCGLWHIGAVMLARSLWDRRGPLHRSAGRLGHMFYAGQFELRVGFIAGLGTLPLLALWRFERALWEAPYVNTPWAAETFQRNYGLFETALLLQVALIHWLIVWHVARRALRHDARRATPKLTSPARCGWCGYEQPAPRCPECGKDPSNPEEVRLKLSLGWIDRAHWLRWIFTTPTALALVAFLFFSPIWLPFARHLVAFIRP